MFKLAREVVSVMRETESASLDQTGLISIEWRDQPPDQDYKPRDEHLKRNTLRITDAIVER